MTESSTTGNADRNRRVRAVWDTLAALTAMAITALPMRWLVGKVAQHVVLDHGSSPAIAQHSATVAADLAETLTVVVALVLFYRLSHTGSMAGLGLRARSAGWLMAGLLLPLGGLLVGVGAAALTGWLRPRGLLYPGPWPLLLAVAAATHAAWIEELVFRGVLLSGIERALSKPAAVLTTAAVFTLMHLGAPFSLSPAWWVIVAGGGLGLAGSFYGAGRNLWLPIGLHGGFTLWTFLIFGLPNVTRGALVWEVDSAAAALAGQAGAVLLVATAFTGVALLALLRRWQASRLTSALPHVGRLEHRRIGEGERR